MALTISQTRAMLKKLFLLFFFVTSVYCFTKAQSTRDVAPSTPSRAQYQSVKKSCKKDNAFQNLFKKDKKNEILAFRKRNSFLSIALV